MPLEPVIGQDAAQVRMIVKDDAEHVERLALEPVGAREHRDRAWHRLVLANRHLDADAAVLMHAEQVVNHVETKPALRSVRSEERRLGKEWVSTCRTRCSPSN